MRDVQEFLDTIIVPALIALGLDTVQARQILLGTALQESGLRDIAQEGGGPAVGFFQMEPATRNDLDIWLRARHPEWLECVEGLTGGVQEAAYARLLYERCPGALPVEIPAQAAYYKHWYNTPLGKATVEEYLRHWASAEGVDFTKAPLEQFAGAELDSSPAPLPVLQPVDPLLALLNLPVDPLLALSNLPVDPLLALSNLDEPVTEVEDHGELPEAPE